MRRNLVVVFFCVLAALMSWRAVYLQMTQHERLQRYSDRISLREITTAAHRGMITDRNGQPLAVSTPVDSVWAEPRVIANKSSVLKTLSEILGLKVAHLETILKPRMDRDFVYLKRHVSPAMSAALTQANLDGVHLQKEYKRFYPASEVTSHLLGFTNVDDRGQEGVELAFDAELRGEPGRKRVVRDRRGEVIDAVAEITPVKPGKQLRLSIDRQLQYVSYRELKAAVKKHRALSGSIVVLDVATGEILALANQPSFNPNNRKGLLGEFYRNRAATDVFEPGSTLKPFTVAAALESGRYQADTKINTAPGYYTIGEHVVRDIENLGSITVAEVIRHSSNVGASKLALALERESLWRFLGRYGFGTPTGVGLPGEVQGRLSHFSNWSDIEQATLAFGYGMSVTVLQLAQAYHIIANDGVRIPLSIQVTDAKPGGERVLAPHTARVLREMMAAVVEEGTGKLATIEGFSVAGKTGTVHKLTRSGYAEDRYRSLFAGMVPADAPRLVSIVVIDEPREGDYFGGQVAAPVFADVMREATRVMNLAPDRPREIAAPRADYIAARGRSNSVVLP